MKTDNKNTNLIAGAGFSGAVMARKIAEELDEPVLVIDKKNHIGGNSYDYKNNQGICVHKYGSHIFHTNNKNVWNFVNRFAVFNTYMHKVLACIDGIQTTIPFNFNTVHEVFPKKLAEQLETKLLETFEYNSRVPILEFRKYNDKDLNFLADFIYEKIFLNYTIKQWGFSPEEIDNSVSARVPVLISKDSRYFQDKYQGIPIDGYTKLIENMLNHPNIKVLTNTSYNEVKCEKFKKIFYTGSIDEFFDYEYGELPYRSVEFKIEEHETEFWQQNSVVNYPDNYDFTRIHEYKYYLNNKSKTTIIAKEFSKQYKKGVNDPYYPIQNEENNILYTKYEKLSEQTPDVKFLGRLGDYKYYDMDKAIARALNVFEEIYSKSYEKIKI